jgi:hypothetical protein
MRREGIKIQERRGDIGKESKRKNKYKKRKTKGRRKRRA